MMQLKHLKPVLFGLFLFLAACAGESGEHYFGEPPDYLPPERLRQEVRGGVGAGAPRDSEPYLTVDDNGETYRRIGGTTIRSDGTTFVQSGNTTIGSDGVSYRQIGTTTVGSDGTVCRRPISSGRC